MDSLLATLPNLHQKDPAESLVANAHAASCKFLIQDGLLIVRLPSWAAGLGTRTHTTIGRLTSD